VIDLPIIPINDDNTQKALSLLVSVEDRRDRIREQHLSILEIDVNLSDSPLIPTTEEMLNRYVEQELLKELKAEMKKVITNG